MIRYIIIVLSLSCFSFGIHQDKETFVIVKGKKQYYRSVGAGNPVVVLVAGLGPPMIEFFELQEELSKKTRVVSYDRAGIGKSESLNTERNLKNICAELKELVDKIGLDKSFILVGHSRGGLIARYFLDKYSDRVCGLVLIDPAIPEHKMMKRALRTDIEKTELDKYYNSFCTDSTKYSATIRSEFRNTFTTDSASVAGKGFPLNIPITLIASNKITEDKYSQEENKIKVELLNNYLKINPQIKMVMTDKSGHFIHDDEPKLVIEEITSMIEKVKGAK
ncbi:MAG: alpha/beta hydrolase [Bacteroidota bacterium]